MRKQKRGDPLGAGVRDQLRIGGYDPGPLASGGPRVQLPLRHLLLLAVDRVAYSVLPVDFALDAVDVSFDRSLDHLIVENERGRGEGATHAPIGIADEPTGEARIEIPGFDPSPVD